MVGVVVFSEINLNTARNYCSTKLSLRMMKEGEVLECMVGTKYGNMDVPVSFQ